MCEAPVDQTQKDTSAISAAVRSEVRAKMPKRGATLTAIPIVARDEAPNGPLTDPALTGAGASTDPAMAVIRITRNRRCIVRLFLIFSSIRSVLKQKSSSRSKVATILEASVALPDSRAHGRAACIRHKPESLRTDPRPSRLQNSTNWSEWCRFSSRNSGGATRLCPRTGRRTPLCLSRA